MSLYVGGAVEICTPGNTSGRELLCRTIIQPDADIITWVTPEVVSQRDALSEHLGRIRAEVRRIRRFRAAFRWSPALPLILGAIYGFAHAKMPCWALGFTSVSLSFLMKAIVRFSMQWSVKRGFRTR